MCVCVHECTDKQEGRDTCTVTHTSHIGISRTVLDECVHVHDIHTYIDKLGRIYMYTYIPYYVFVRCTS